MSEQLLPCPFCGCTHPPVMHENSIGKWLECLGCLTTTRSHEDVKECQRDWNTRAPVYASKLTEAMIDSARGFFLALECGVTSIERMREHVIRWNGPDISFLPDWFTKGEGHLTKAGRAIIAWHLMNHAQRLATSAPTTKDTGGEG